MEIRASLDGDDDFRTLQPIVTYQIFFNPEEVSPEIHRF
jgi:hypothetical protein